MRYIHLMLSLNSLLGTVAAITIKNPILIVLNVGFSIYFIVRFLQNY